jgi:hypothetical protein
MNANVTSGIMLHSGKKCVEGRFLAVPRNGPDGLEEIVRRLVESITGRGGKQNV